jgi:5-methylthioadenosine/S-adenosylhomocysteine deaminase
VTTSPSARPYDGERPAAAPGLVAPDPTADPYVLIGRVVTMDDGSTVLDRGAVYVAGGSISAVSPAAAPPPAGFESAARIAVGGTIYPGLIELHNHLSYDVLRLWAVPTTFPNRDRWSSGPVHGPVYRRLISGPMQVLGRTPGLPEAVVRYVEMKCLLGGTTTSQGIALYSNAGIQRYYRGVIRNVEETGDPALPDAATRIPDVDASEAARFLARLSTSWRLVLHLSEGTDPSAHAHFEALHLPDGSWAMTPALVGIHCVALTREDYDVMAAHGASMVWSPLSNLLLYGGTADVAAARAAGVTVGLGSDWSPSGSKNLLFELKVARILAQASGMSDRELVAAATRDAAQILGWSVLGTIEAGMRADLIVIGGRQGDPYGHLIDAGEADVELVLVDGIPRAGRPALMGSFRLGGEPESVRVGGARRLVHAREPGVDPLIEGLSLAEATERLADALADLPRLAAELERPMPTIGPGGLAPGRPTWSLLLDHDEPAGVALRPHLPDPTGRPTARLDPDLAAAAAPLSQVLEPLALDPLTVAGDGDFLDRLLAERNLPPAVVDGLKHLT